MTVQLITHTPEIAPDAEHRLTRTRKNVTIAIVTMIRGGVRMNNLKGIKPGDDVHVIDDKGNCETYLFLAKVKHAVLAMPFPWGKEDIKDALDTLIYDTDSGLGANVEVFPAKRCFARIEDAAAAIEGERGRKE